MLKQGIVAEYDTPIGIKERYSVGHRIIVSLDKVSEVNDEEQVS